MLQSVPANTMKDDVLSNQQMSDTFSPPRLRCVLMDDSDFDRRSLMRVAEKSRYAVDFVETKSIDQTRGAISGIVPPDIVLLDYRVPDGNGIDFARELCRGRSKQPFSVILITGDSASQTAIDALRAGVADFLPKDQLTVELFDGAIENALLASGKAQGEDRLHGISADTDLKSLRELALNNMRQLKGAVLPVLAMSWKAANGKLINDDSRTELRSALAQRAREIPALIDDLLIAAMTESTEPTAENVALGPLVQSIVQDGADTVLENGAQVRVGPLPDVITDPNRMKLLLGLLINGASLGAGIGQPAQINVGSGSDPSGNVVVWVRDKGLELAVRRQNLGRSLTDVGVPSGADTDPFSWSVCQRIAEQLGGKFKVSDDPEGGVKAMVLLPASRRA